MRDHKFIVRSSSGGWLRDLLILAVILGIHAIRGHRVLVDALLPHGAQVRLKAGVIKQVFWSTPSTFLRVLGAALAFSPRRGFALL